MKPTKQQKLYYTLRIAIAMCFIGHGAFGIIGKEIWCNYFGVFGIGRELSYKLMPWVGISDILLGIVALFFPLRIVAVWLVIWGIFTALLRPLSGEYFAEFLERAGNFGAPFAFLLVTSSLPLQFKSLFGVAKVPGKINEQDQLNLFRFLSLFAFLLLAGHGWLNLVEKKSLVEQFGKLGFSQPARVAFSVGIFEVLMAFLLLIKPSRYLLLFLVIWKMGSELFYPHYEIFEWVERGGSYAVLLCLYFTLDNKMEQEYPVAGHQKIIIQHGE